MPLNESEVKMLDFTKENVVYELVEIKIGSETKKFEKVVSLKIENNYLIISKETFETYVYPVNLITELYFTEIPF